MRRPIQPILALLTTAVIAGSLVILPDAAAKEFSAGVNITDKAAIAQTGLGAYPGSRPADKSRSEASDAHIDFSFGGYGLKVVVVRLQTNDATDKVAAYYRSDLARYGEVIDCSAPQAPRAKSKKDEDEDDTLVCKKNESKKDAITYRVGTRKNQRVASIESADGVTKITLVRVEVRKP